MLRLLAQVYRRRLSAVICRLDACRLSFKSFSDTARSIPARLRLVSCWNSFFGIGSRLRGKGKLVAAANRHWRFLLFVFGHWYSFQVQLAHLHALHPSGHSLHHAAEVSQLLIKTLVKAYLFSKPVKHHTLELHIVLLQCQALELL